MKILSNSFDSLQFIEILPNSITLLEFLNSANSACTYEVLTYLGENGFGSAHALVAADQPRPAQASPAQHSGMDQRLRSLLPPGPA